MRILCSGLASLTLACYLFFTMLELPASAGNPTKPAPETKETTQRAVQSVDAATSSVVIVYKVLSQTMGKTPTAPTTKTSRSSTYKIDDFTALKVNGVSAKVPDIKAGMVVADLVERDADTLDLLTLTGFGTEATNPDASKKKKK